MLRLFVVAEKPNAGQTLHPFPIHDLRAMDDLTQYTNRPLAFFARYSVRLECIAALHSDHWRDRISGHGQRLDGGVPDRYLRHRRCSDFPHRRRR